MKKILSLFLLALVMGAGFLFYTETVKAATPLTFGLNQTGQTLGLGGDDIRLIIARIIRAVLGFLGILALCIVLYGGFVYMTAGGDEEKVGKAKKIIINGVIGLAIILSAFAIAQFVINKLAEATGANVGVPNACIDIPGYAPAHPLECYGSGFCKADKITQQFCCYTDHFVVKSITPVTSGADITPSVTGMNNVAIRFIFSQPLAADSLGSFIIHKGSEDITKHFTFSFIDSNKPVAVEAVPDDTFKCSVGTNCLDFGDYTAEVSSSIKNAAGVAIQSDTGDCGLYPLKGEFTVDRKNTIPVSGSYLNFNGKNSYVEINNPISLSNVSVSSWVKPQFSATTSVQAYVIYQIGAQGKDGFHMLYLVKKGGDTEKVYLVWQYGNGTSNSLFSQFFGTVSEVTNKWVNIGVSHDYGNKLIKFYVNGQQFAVHNHLDSVMPVENKTSSIGAYFTWSNFFNGGIDEVLIFNKVLTSSDFKSLYGDGKGKYSYLLPDKNNLVAGWNFDEQSGNIVNDISSAGNNKGNIFNVERITNASAEREFVKDTTPPQFPLGLDINGEVGTYHDLAAGRGFYQFHAHVTDDSGAGYANFKIQRISDGQQLEDYYDGPSINIGSETSNDTGGTYQFAYPYGLVGDVATPESYLATLKACDIDHNCSVVTTTFRILPEHCSNGILDLDKGEGPIADQGDGCTHGVGEPCKTNLDCAYSLKCVSSETDGTNKTCQAYPLIEEVSPMDGATGNWLTIKGRNFGEGNVGSVTFFTNDDKNKPVVAQVAKCVSCSGTNAPAWHDHWVVVEIPADDLVKGFKVDSTSSIRLQVNYPFPVKLNGTVGVKTYDDTTYNDPLVNDWGLLPGGNGLFTKNTTWRPGLCDVYVAGTCAHSGVVGTSTIAVGKGFGPTQITGANLNFGGFTPSIYGWTESLIRSEVPAGLQAGDVGVYVHAGANQDSNKVPFTILTNIDALKPEIDRIDPVSSTPGSFITIHGRNFGESVGQVYFTAKAGESCGAGCVRATTTLPDYCGDAWHDNQVIVQLVRNSFPELTGGVLPFDFLKLTDKLPGFYLSNNIIPVDSNVVISDPQGKYAMDSSEWHYIIDLKIENLPSITAKTERFRFQKDEVTDPSGYSGGGGYRFSIFDEKDPGGVLHRSFYGGPPKDTLNPGEFAVIKEISTSTNQVIKIDSDSSGLRLFDSVGLVYSTTTNPGSGQPSSVTPTGTVRYGGVGVNVNKLQFTKGSQESLDLLEKFVTLVRGDQNKFKSDGDTPFTVRKGNPLPGICAIEPSHGPAPLATGNFLAIKGINFGTNPIVYFFWKNAALTNVFTWLNSKDYKDQNGASVIFPTSDSNTLINTAIPVDLVTRYTMVKGKNPIKIVSQGEIGNDYDYVVDDCNLPSSIAPDGKKVNSAYQCCTEGLDMGIWRLNTTACAGQTKSAGYVWRFTTGRIPYLPRVLEHCDQANWFTGGFDNQYPSPVPWQNWRGGDNVCLNAEISLQFTAGINVNSINTSTVRVYKCGGGDKPVCGTYTNQVDGSQLSLVLGNSTLLEIFKADSSATPQKLLTANTWYRVTLAGSISSTLQTIYGAGQTMQKSFNLDVTRPLKDYPGGGIAYYYDFKTGATNKRCELKDAFMNPTEHTTHNLGPLKDFWQPTLLFYYFLWGRGDQECIVLNVDSYNWAWNTSNRDTATATSSPLSPYYRSSRGTATALQDAPYGVTILATTTGLSYVETVDVLKNINNGQPLTTPITTSTLVGGDFNTFASYTLKIVYELNDLSSSTIINIGSQNADKDWMVRRSLFLSDGSDVYISDVYTSSTYELKNRYFNYRESYNNGTSNFLEHLNTNSTGEYLIQKNESGNLSLVKNGVVVSSVVLNGNQVVGKISGNYYFEGGAVGGNQSLRGVIDSFVVTKLVQNSNTSTIEATSTLKIDLGPPRVIDEWPLCTEACTNATIGVKFSRAMMTSTYGLAAFIVDQCIDETCDSVTGYHPILDDQFGKDDPMQYEVTVSGLPLNENTWYRVTVSSKDPTHTMSGSMRSFGRVNPDTGAIDPGKPLEDFTWKFRTKVVNGYCIAENVAVEPDPFIAYFVGHRNKYISIPRTAPDMCNASGQRLNPWNYGWIWDITKPFGNIVASITHFPAPPITSMHPYCNLSCLLKGADVPRGSVPVLCGDGNADEPGKDCDIDASGEIAGVSCNLNCLRPGNLKATSTTSTANLGLCGDGQWSSTAGEMCDPGNPTQKAYCNDKCLWKGSSQTPPLGNTSISWCGSGGVTWGETCDTALVTTTAKSNLSCTNHCLHTGVPLSKYWCMQADHSSLYPTECAQAQSVCGNGKIEAGEECEIIDGHHLRILTGNDPNDPSASTTISVATSSLALCSDWCVLNNLCEETKADPNSQIKNSSFGFYCTPGTAGCANDCTLAGSSLLASPSSTMCGDAIKSSGEFGACEFDHQPTGSLGEGPIQVATAVGGGSPQEGANYLEATTTAKANTTIIYGKTANGIVFTSTTLMSKNVTGTSTYHLQCGHQENNIQDAYGYYNDCLPTDMEMNHASSTNAWGVARNSCCSARPERKSEYPIDGASIYGAGLVCRNTFISVDFDKRIDPNSLKNNIIIANGHNYSTYDCLISIYATTTDVTNLVNRALGLSDSLKHPSIPMGFLDKIWHYIKSFFAWLFGEPTWATYLDKNFFTNYTWCTGEVAATYKVTDHWSMVNGVASTTMPVSSTVAVYINDLLNSTSTYAVVLRGGKGGITDINGVGIRGKDTTSTLDDIWLFNTSDKICKLRAVTVEPGEFLFQKPNVTSSFQAITESDNGQQIVPTPAYHWYWEWAPQNSPIFNIPLTGTPTNTDKVIIGVRNLEGEQIAVAKAVVDADISATKLPVFTGTTDLMAYFCNNPWPALPNFPFKDNDYNFSLSYCADAGSSDTTDDDLPLFTLLDVTKQNVVAQSGVCLLGGAICNTDTDCLPAYNMPWINGGPPAPGFNANCPEKGSAQVLSDNNCKLLFSTTGKFCRKADDFDFPPKYSKDYRSCNTDADCLTDLSEVCLPTAPWLPITNSCEGAVLAASTFSSALTPDTEKRYLLFSTSTGDAIGLQIFKNLDSNGNDSSQSARSWYNQHFSNTVSMQSGKIDNGNYNGDDVITDGRNYYISALNYHYTGSPLTHDIYQLGLSSGASQEAQAVFTKLINSWKFNTNLEDFNYCLSTDTPHLVIGQILPSSTRAIISDDACKTDWDCHDLVSGTSKTDANGIYTNNGICSNSRTKFYTDINTVLPNIKTAMQNLEGYGTKSPNLAAGTFIPGYTVSKWASWYNILHLNKIDPIDNWIKCSDPKADPNTCWNAASSTYSCPVYSSVSEYEYVGTTTPGGAENYVLHTPLQYFSKSDTEVVGNYVMNPDHFSTDPWCTPGQSYSPFVGKCGDGIVQVGEDCDPPGSSVTSSRGVVVSRYGTCYVTSSLGVSEVLPAPSTCINNDSCGYYEATIINGSEHYRHSLKTSFCTVDKQDGDDLKLLDLSIIKNPDANSKETEYFSCDTDADCQSTATYLGANEIQLGGLFGGELTRSGYAVKVVTSTGSDFINNYFGANGIGTRFACVGKVNDTWFPKLTSQCVGYVTNIVQCSDVPGYVLGSEHCDNLCRWQFGECKSLSTCKNGLVEPGEKCDDGAQNGTYGHCATDCLGLFSGYCGNGQIDQDLGKPLEYCENTFKAVSSPTIHPINNVYVNYRKSVGFCTNVSSRVCSENFDCTSALVFSGSKDYAEYGGEFEMPKNFTIEMWVKLTDIVGHPKNQLLTIIDQNQPAKKLSITTYKNTTDNKLNIDVASQINSNTSTIHLKSLNTIGENEWTFLAFAYDSIRQQGTLYVNGVVGGGSINIDLTTSSIYLGGFVSTGNSLFTKGDVDEFRIYSNDLSSDSIQNNYEQGAKHSYSDPNVGDLLLGFHFDEGYSNIASAYKQSSRYKEPFSLKGTTQWEKSSDSLQASACNAKDLSTRLLFGDVLSSDRGKAETTSCNGEYSCLFYHNLVSRALDTTYLTSGQVCQNDPQILCKTNDDCQVPTDVNKILSKNKFSIISDWLDWFATSSDFGPCVPKPAHQIFGASYNYYKDLSCAWDCQKPGGYCGDNHKDDPYEECDEGLNNGKPGSTCNSDCTNKINLAVCGNGNRESGEQCDKGKDNGTPTSTCSAICTSQTPLPQVCGDGIVEGVDISTDNPEVCDNGSQNGVACKSGYNKSCSYCSFDCKKVVTVDPTGFCGNGVIDDMGDVTKGDHGYEVCDTNADGTVVHSYGEGASGPVAQLPSKCNDKDAYSCSANCLSEQDNCVDCKSAENIPSKPFITLLNPFYGDLVDPTLPQYWKYYYNNNYTVGLYRKFPPVGFNAYLGRNVGLFNTMVPPEYGNSLLGLEVGESNFRGLQTNQLCKDEYFLYFNYNNIFPSNNGFDYNANSSSLRLKGDFFPYQVNGESPKISKELVISRAMPEGVFGVVVRYAPGVGVKREEEFYGNVQNDEIFAYYPVNLSQAALDGAVCNYANFASSTPTGCGDLHYNYGGIYVYPYKFAKVDQVNYVDGFIIDTRNATGTYSFSVDQFGALSGTKITPIGEYRNQPNFPLYVDVYEFHPGQDEQYSVFGPTSTYTFSKADNDKGFSAGDQYWHVFNLVKNVASGKYQRQDVQYKKADGTFFPDCPNGSCSNGRLVSDFAGVKEFTPYP